MFYMGFAAYSVCVVYSVLCWVACVALSVCNCLCCFVFNEVNAFIKGARTMLTPMPVRLKLTHDYPPAHAASK
jgi:hypothetical protein